MRILCICIALIAACLLSGFSFGDLKPQAAKPEQHAASGELDRQIDALAEQMVASLADRKISKIAVLEFSDLEGKVPDLGKYLAEELTTRLFRTGKFQIIERQLLKKMMEEQKLSASGLIDEKTASKFGKILGVDALAAGTLADLSTSVKINARLVATETGSVFAVASASVPMSKEVELLLGRKPGTAANSDANRFDGTWDVTLLCPQHADGALGFSYQFSAKVHEATLHGQYGTVGAAPNLTIDGKINPDGSALITAKGLTGDPKYNTVGGKRGTPYSYHVEARFEGTHGTGKRVEGRTCSMTFVKK